MKRIAFSIALLLAGAVPAGAVPVSFTNEGVEGQTTIFRAGLGGIGLGQLASLVIADSNSGVGGSPGIFSGFDLDFAFLDLDGLYATTGDRVYGSVFAFTTGSIRPSGGDPNFEPTLAHPGPTFGSLATNTIDFPLATLDTRDGSYPPIGFNADNSSGWLTLGDGGTLAVGLAAPVTLTGTEALFVGEVGTTAGELVNASVTVSQAPLPEPGTLALALGALGLGAARRYGRTAGRVGRR